MELGQTKALKSEAAGGGFNRHRLREGPNVHRILFGPKRVQMVYYPTLIEDTETGDMVQRAKLLRRPPGGTTPLDVLASLERRIRKDHGEKDPRSNLDPTTRFLYLIVDMEGDDYPKVEVVEYPFKVKEQLIELEEAISTKDANKLRHGLLMMFNVIITKRVDPNKAPMYGTTYTVEVDPDNKYSSKVPKSYLGKAVSELPRLKPERFFTEAEWKSIEENTLVLEDEARADTLEEMQAKLEDFPLFLGGKKDGNYMFPSIELFQKQMEKLGINFLVSDAIDAPAPKRLEESPADSFGEEEETEDAEFEEVEEGEGEEETEDDEDFLEDEDEVFGDEEEEEEEDEEPKPERKSKKKKKSAAKTRESTKKSGTKVGEGKPEW